MPDREIGSCYASASILPWSTDQMRSLFTWQPWFIMGNIHIEAACLPLNFPKHLKISQDTVCCSCGKRGVARSFSFVRSINDGKRTSMPTYLLRDLTVKGNIDGNIEHFLKKTILEKLGISEITEIFFFFFQSFVCYFCKNMNLRLNILLSIDKSVAIDKSKTHVLRIIRSLLLNLR